MRIYLFLVVAALCLAACASPRYQAMYRYEAPLEASAQVCLQSCEPKLGACQSSCQQRHQACLKEIEPLVDARHNAAIKRYENALDNYQFELQQYQLRLSLGWGYSSVWYDPWPFYYPFPEPHFPPPTPPYKPTREDSFNRVRQERCESDCGCQPIYDACFLSCGGKMVPEVKCIANCPKEK